jgi:hypothetical protein
MRALLLLLLACQTEKGGKPSTPDEDDTQSTQDEGGSDDGDADPDCVTDAEFFSQSAVPLLSDCVTCHVEGGAASGSRYVLLPFEAEGAEAENWSRLSAFLSENEDAATLLLTKPTGQTSHGGGERFDLLDAQTAVMTELVGRLQQPGGCASPVPAPMTCDGTIRPGSAPLRLLTEVQYTNLIAAVFGVSLPSGLYPRSERGDGFRTWATSNAVSSAGAESIQLAAEAAAAALSLPADLACAADEAELDCARRFLLEKGALTFRRPLTEAEGALLTRFLDAGVDVDTAVRMGVEVMLQSPQALYLDPRGAGAEAGGPVPVDPHTLAARLAFLYTDAPPDEALRAAAAAGALSTREDLLVAAQRLVQSPDMVGVVARFHQDWLRLDQLDTINKDPALYPNWGPDTVSSLKTEADLFTTEVVWLGEGTYDSLFFSTTTWVDANLAPLYGLPAPDTGWQRVSLDAATRPGLLTRLGWLAAHAHTNSSAPVRRGAFVLEQLLCESLDPPPGINTTLPEIEEETETVRDQLEAHWTDAACSACHVRIDPVGFAFEHYGPAGEWRDLWPDGHPIDASGSLDEPAGDFDGAAELLALVANSDRARACYAQRWFEYAVGRAAEAEDACTLRALSTRFAESDGDLRSLLVDISLTDPMRYRPALEQTP